MKVRKEKGLAPLYFANDVIFIGNVTDVPPHGQILYKHFKKETLMNRIFEGSELLLSQRNRAKQAPIHGISEGDFITDVPPHGQILYKHFKKETLMNRIFEGSELLLSQRNRAKQAPIHGISEGDFIRRRLSTITHDRLAKALVVTFGSFFSHTMIGVFNARCAAGLLVIYFVYHVLQFFIFRCMGLAEGEGVVPVCFCWVVERSNLVYYNMYRFMSFVNSSCLNSFVFLRFCNAYP
mmetsp:Transcript_21673/g.32119  ORF Transcript_21673/g.32119 Transcript_21673/m.32119 type:complete len:237 (-) Transcript_21673:99-809(-)